MKSIPGKIPYIKTFQIQLGLSTGTMTDFVNWTTTSLDAEICVSLNDTVLYCGQIDNGQRQFNFTINDTDTHNDQLFKIELRSIPEVKNDQHPMLKIDYIWIENLNMRKTLEDSGTCIFHASGAKVNVPSEYMGEPGAQILKFATPIYPWLLENERCSNYYYK